MLSRVAERIYWFGRYLERAESTARLVNVSANLLLDLPRGVRLGWHSLIAITGTDEAFSAHYQQAEERNVVKFLLADADNSSSVLSSLRAVREALRSAREIVPAESFEHINNLYLFARDNVTVGLTRAKRHDFLKELIDGCQLVVGQMSGTMSHDSAYTFGRLGRNLERADMTTRIIDVGAANLFPRRADPLQAVIGEASEDATPYDDIMWMNVLRSLSAYQMYRQHVRDRINGEDVVAFALQDRKFPRSVAHCLSELQLCLAELPRFEEAQRSVASAQRRVMDADVAKLINEGLHEFIDDLQVDLAGVHGHIAETWFLPQSAA